jgi:ATP-dependent helicase Lhr and Lhr-like helicase
VKLVYNDKLMQQISFHSAIVKWFKHKFGSPTEPQQFGWPAIQSGANTLVAAPTGSGKTLAAFLASLDELFQIGLRGKLRDEIYVVYVSPLKALSNDIHKNLEEPLVEIRDALKNRRRKRNPNPIRRSHRRHTRCAAPRAY